jgi:hypothetical protein
VAAEKYPLSCIGFEASPAVLLSRLKELQDLLQSPGGVLHERRVQPLSMFIARRTPNLSIRALAMQVMKRITTGCA